MASTTANALAAASSSYLRSAAHQPIQWHEWGPDAFARAQAEDKPILLDIGAVWCHWCHVMDHESYEDPEIAGVLNQHFIAVKVDRDERPDVDSRYQAAVQAMSGQGGWPLTVFMTPDGRPFFGGTYFPPDDKFGRPGFRRILLAIAQAYREKRDEVAESAGAVMSALEQAEAFTGRAGDINPQVPARIVQSAVSMFDRQHGGFGSAPKFPHPGAIDLVIDRYARSSDDDLRTVIATTLERMAKGGVYDQLAGGFHRYSVDEKWIVPHFEKMSYDNSELLKNYVHAFQATGEPFFAHVARDIIRWLDATLTDRQHGGFYASQDADISLHDDGDYFTWSLAEARAVLTEDELNVAAQHFDIGEVGEMHHDHSRNVLYVRAGVPTIAARTGQHPDRVRELLDSARQKMFAARLQRKTPYVDGTIYVSWNALCVSAYLEAARALDLPNARQFALRSLDRILAEGWNAERRSLRHLIAYSDAKSPARETRGLLDDYCFAVIACLDAYETTADLSYFRFARQIADSLIERFADREHGGFFDTPLPEFATGDATLGALVARRKPFQDSPTPAGNPAAAIALLRLFHFTGDNQYREHAERTLRLFAGVAEQFGIFAATYGVAVQIFAEPGPQIVVIGEGPQAEALLSVANSVFLLGKSVLRLTENELVAPNLPPAIAQTVLNVPRKPGEAAALVCSNFTCRPPITDAEQLSTAVREFSKS
jgi:uncharacterized protein YyaL (SSP411 family)